MELEYAFFAAQSQGTAEDDRPAGQGHGDVVCGDGANIRFAVGNVWRLNGVHGRVALLCVDFDDTLTDGDTTSLLVKTAEAHVSLTKVCSAVAILGLLALCHRSHSISVDELLGKL